MFRPIALLIAVLAISFTPVPSAQADLLSTDTLSEIPMVALSLIGKPYKYGGKNPETGVDCSGFVGYVFKQALGVQLPPSAHLISRQGLALTLGQLQPGDLVFFNTLHRAFSHVGIYLGDNRFIHSSSTGTGVVKISDMTDRYWANRFEGARRISPTDLDSGIEAR